MKKIISVILVAILVLAFAACAEKEKESKYAHLTSDIATTDAPDVTGTVTETEATTEAEPEPVAEVDYSNPATGTYVDSYDFYRVITVKAMTDGTYLVSYGENGNVLEDMPATLVDGVLSAAFEDTYPDDPGYVSLESDSGSVFDCYSAGSRGSRFVGTDDEEFSLEKISDSVDVAAVYKDSINANSNAEVANVFKQIGASSPEFAPTVTLYDDNTFDFLCNMFYGMFELRGVWYKTESETEIKYFFTLQYAKTSSGYIDLPLEELSYVTSFCLTMQKNGDKLVFSAPGEYISIGITGEDGSGLDTFVVAQ